LSFPRSPRNFLSGRCGRLLPENTTSTLAQALMRNKVMGWYDAAANASTDITNFGLNRSGLDPYFPVKIQCNGSSSKIPSTSEINIAASNFPAGRVWILSGG